MTASGGDAIALNVARYGEGDPVIVLHGLYGAGSNWRRHANWLARDHRVLVPDLRNHGDSPHDEVMTYPAMAADIERLLDDEGLTRATVLGHSMGGKAAMALALTRPQRVSALIVADIAPVAYEHEHEHIIAAMQAVPLETLETRQEADGALAEAVPEAPVRQFLLTNLQRRDGNWQWRIPLSILRRSLPGILGFPDHHGRYDGPALFVHGERSEYVDDSARDAIRRRFPNASVVALPDAGHFLHVEQPEAFAGVVRDFLTSAHAQ